MVHNNNTTTTIARASTTTNIATATQYGTNSWPTVLWEVINNLPRSTVVSIKEHNKIKIKEEKKFYSQMEWRVEIDGHMIQSEFLLVSVSIYHISMKKIDHQGSIKINWDELKSHSDRLS